jgi:hypothetical protein
MPTDDGRDRVDDPTASAAVDRGRGGDEKEVEAVGEWAPPVKTEAGIPV